MLDYPGSRVCLFVLGLLLLVSACGGGSKGKASAPQDALPIDGSNDSVTDAPVSPDTTGTAWLPDVSAQTDGVSNLPVGDAGTAGDLGLTVISDANPTCGSPGFACCAGNSCDNGGCCVGGVCASGGVTCPGLGGGRCDKGACGACGGPGLPCCADSKGAEACTAAGTRCLNGVCARCGGSPGTPCCTGNTASPVENLCLVSGLMCNNGLCLSCGKAGEACCPGQSCAAGSCCYNSTCVREGQTCGIAGGTCSAGRCAACGGADQPCCSGECYDGRVCSAGFCTACGDLGGTCCAGNTCKSGCCANGLCVADQSLCVGADAGPPDSRLSVDAPADLVLHEVAARDTLAVDTVALAPDTALLPIDAVFLAPDSAPSDTSFDIALLSPDAPLDAYVPPADAYVNPADASPIPDAACVAQCLTRQCGSVLDSCGNPVSCGECLPSQACTGEGTCVLPGTIETFGSCDRSIYALEGRKGQWYFYRGTGVGCEVGSCNGVSAPPWGTQCAAWTSGGRYSSTDLYAGMGVGLNSTGILYNACDYTSVEVSYASDQAVRMYAKWDDIGTYGSRSSVLLPATTGVVTSTISFSSFTGLDCSTMTEFQFEPTSIPAGFGIAVYSLRFKSASAPACATGDMRCVAGGGIEVCTAGAWTSSTCPVGQVCTTDRCVAENARPVDVHGHLSVSGTRLVNQYGTPVQLKGVSSHWLNYEPDGYALNATALTWMRDNWNLSLIRAAMGVDTVGGYLDSAAGRTAMLGQVETIIANAVSAGVYVLVDWHSHQAHLQQVEAVAFFTDLSARYGHLPNVLFETYNEPLNVSWSTTLKPYHQAVLNAIRGNDPDTHPNVVVLGTPNWDQDVDAAAASPLTGSNLMYTVHFYSCDHNATSGHLGVAQTALSNGLPIFVSEWGATKADGGVDGSAACPTQADAWHTWMNANGISWAAWKLDDCDYEITTNGVADTSCLLGLNTPLTGGWTSTTLNGHAEYVVSKMQE